MSDAVMAPSDPVWSTEQKSDSSVAERDSSESSNDDKPRLSLVFSQAPTAVESGGTGDPLEQIIRRWVKKACEHARTLHVDPQVWVAEVVGLDGVWSDGTTRRAALANLSSVVDDWVRMKLADGDTDIPPMEGIKLVVED